MRVEDYNTHIKSVNNIINRAIALFESPTSTAGDVANVVKGIEVIYKPKLLDKFPDFFPKLFLKISTLSADSPNSMELMFLARALAQEGNKDTDFDNLNINGSVVVGNRALEHFDDKVLEKFYKET